MNRVDVAFDKAAYVPGRRQQAEKVLAGAAQVVGIDLNELAEPVYGLMLAAVLDDPRTVIAGLERIKHDAEQAAGRAQRIADGTAAFRKARRKHGRRPQEAPLWQRGIRQPKQFRWRETRPLPGWVPPTPA